MTTTIDRITDLERQLESARRLAVLFENETRELAAGVDELAAEVARLQARNDDLVTRLVIEENGRRHAELQVSALNAQLTAVNTRLADQGGHR